MRRPRRPHRSSLTAPTNVLDELDRELRETAFELARGVERLSSLTELQHIAVAAALRFGRPATVFDIFEAAATEDERLQIERLVGMLRTRPSGDRRHRAW